MVLVRLQRPVGRGLLLTCSRSDGALTTAGRVRGTGREQPAGTSSAQSRQLPVSWPPDSSGWAHVLLVSFEVSELGAVGFPRFVRMEAFLCHSRAEERSLTAEPGLGQDPERGLLSSGTRLITFGGADASMWHQTGVPGKHW